MPAYQLEVVAEDGQMLWRLPLRPGEQVTLAYINSLYNALTEERFTVTADGFVLTEVRSTSDAVLAHNALPGPYVRAGPFFAAQKRLHIHTLVLRIGQTGQQRLTVGGRELPLYAAGVGNQLKIHVRRLPVILQIARQARLWWATQDG